MAAIYLSTYCCIKYSLLFIFVKAQIKKSNNIRKSIDKLRIIQFLLFQTGFVSINFMQKKNISELSYIKHATKSQHLWQFNSYSAGIYQILCSHAHSTDYSIAEQRIKFIFVSRMFIYKINYRLQKMIIQFAISVVLVFSTLVYYFLVIKPRKTFKWYADNIRKIGYRPLQIPFKPFGVSFIEVYREGEKQGDSLKQARQQYKDHDIVIANCLNKIMITFTHHDFIKEFYSSNNTNTFKKMANVTNNLKRGLGEGIIFSEGEVWKRKRHIITSLFNFDFIKSLTNKIVQICDRSIKKIQEQHQLIQYSDGSSKIGAYQYQIIDLAIKIFSTVIMQCFLGGIAEQRIQGQEACTFINKLIIDVTQQGMKPFVLIFGPAVISLGLTSQDRDIKRRLKKFKQWAMQYIKVKIDETKHKIKNTKNTQFVPSDLIEALIKNSLAQDSKFHIYAQSQILEQFCTFLIAGTDTTAHFTLMMIYFISKNPEVQQKLREEIQQYMSENDFSHQNLKKLKYIDNIQKQTGRLYGIGTNIFPRIATEDNYINKLPILKGTIVTVSQMGNHHSPEYFKNPLQFRPQRWESECDEIPIFAYGTFGGGARSCIGKHLAMLENKIAIIKFYQRYRKIILPKQDIKMAFKFVYSPEYLLTKQVLN